jgi:glutamate---cysteine ligase / carboxylate-amine ligase
VIDEATATGRSMGVEEEFLLVDPGHGGPVPLAARVLPGARAALPAAPRPELHAELLATQVESATAPCTTVDELRRQLTCGRDALAGAAARAGLMLVSAGTPVLAGPPPVATEGPRFERITGTYAAVVADYQACGCHVHVGVPDRETAVAVLNHVRPWLPTLLVLSGNSALHHGVDTGYQSWRMVQQSRFPGSGPPPWFASAADYDRAVARLVDCGVLVDASMSFWLVRLGSRLPTVEFRVADACATVEESLLQAALSRALVRTALAELAAGRQAPPGDDLLAPAAVWSAARHGPHGPGVHPVHGGQVSAAELVRELVLLLTPALADTGDLDFVRAAVSTVLRGGTGADRQRAAADPRAALDLVTVHGSPRSGYARSS